MKIPKEMFNEKLLELNKKAYMPIDFDKDYTEDELVDLIGEMQQSCLDFGFIKGEPNKDCELWEKICDDLTDFVEKYYK